MTLKQRIARSFRLFGYDLTRYQPNRHPVAQLIQLISGAKTGLVLDVGANRGQYATELRASGYRGKIVSFEPLKEAYAVLSQAAAGDPQWEARNVALGSAPGRSTIHVAGNSTSSSLLEMLPAHLDSAPQSKYVATEEIEVECLNRVMPGLLPVEGSVWLKVDTQGFETQVLAGASEVLGKVASVQLEMSLVPLYAGAPSFESLLGWMKERGYQLVALQPGFTDPASGRLLQVDGIFQAG
jgi:FkbM family methyltransferase